MASSDDTQGISYRDFFQIQYNSLRDDISALRSVIKELSSSIATKRDFDSFRVTLEEKFKRMELETYQLNEALNELEKIVRTNEREILFYRRALAFTGALVIPMFLGWAKGVLGI